MTTQKIGTLYGVGVGPGDAELMTRKAYRILNESQVIAVPRSVDSAEDGLSKALSIVEQAITLTGKVILELDFPMTRDKDALGASRRKAAGAIAAHLAAGRDAAFITLGDPLLYSTFSYLMPFVRKAIPEARIEVIPGVTSFCSAAAAACIPLVEAGEKLYVIPAAYDMEEVKTALTAFDTVVLMKVNKSIDKVVDLLSGMGLDNNATFVSRAGWPGQEIVSGVAGLKGRKLDYFSLIIVKKAGA